MQASPSLCEQLQPVIAAALVLFRCATKVLSPNVLLQAEGGKNDIKIKKRIIAERRWDKQGSC